MNDLRFSLRHLLKHPGFTAVAILVIAGRDASARDIAQFGILEEVFTQEGTYSNAYVQVSATATFVQPDGGTRPIPLFWDGKATWKVRFSPDRIGAWSWSVSSSDPGLNQA